MSLLGTGRNWYRSRSLLVVAAIWAGLGGVAGLLALAGGYAPAPAGFWAAALGAGVWVAAKWPGALTSVVIVTLATALAPSAGFVYGAGAAGLNLDLGGAILVTVVLLVMGALIAHRINRRFAWVTVLFVCLAVVLVGPALVLLAPQAGFAWAWGLEALVLWVASGQPKRLLKAVARRVWCLVTRQPGRRGTGALPSGLSPAKAEVLGDEVQHGARTGRGVMTAWTVDTPDVLAGHWHARAVTGFWINGVPVVGCAMAGPVTIDESRGLLDDGVARNRLLLGLVEALGEANRGVSTGVDTLVVAIDAVRGCGFKTAMLYLTTDEGQAVTVALADLSAAGGVAWAVRMAASTPLAG